MKTRYFIKKATKKELDLIITILATLDEYTWEIPIRYLIPTDYECTVLGDAYLERGEAFCNKF